MKSLKIALLTYSTKPRGGVVHTLSLAEELARLGHCVHVYALSSSDVSEAVSKTHELSNEQEYGTKNLGSPPVSLVDIKSGFFRPVSVPYTIIPCVAVASETIDEKVERYIKVYSEFMAAVKESYDIYHAEDCISANVLFELRSRDLIKFFIRTVHHIDDFTSQSLIDCQLKSILAPDHLVVVSGLWEKILRSEYSLNPTIINNGVDLEKFSIEKGADIKEKAKESFSVKGRKVILSIGGIEPRKNTLATLRAFSIAKSYFNRRGERLTWLIGGGETLFDYRAYRDEFFSQVRRSGCELSQDIILLGNVPDDSIPRLYNAADVFVFPSVKEGWGLVVLEAMASGLPVITSNIEPMTEYLRDKENSILVSPMDYEALARQIISVLENPELRDKLITNGRKTAEAYSWGNTASRHVEFYRGVLKASDSLT